MQINLVGQIYGCLGIPNHTRDLFDAIINRTKDSCNIRVFPISSHAMPYGISNVLRDRITPPAEFMNVEGLTIVFWSPDVYPNILPRINRAKSIVCGYLIFEWTKLTDKYVENANLMDYLLVPSTWARDVLIANGIDSNKIIVVRAGLSKTFANLTYTSPGPSGTLSYPPKFLCVGKWETRKSYDIVLNTWFKMIRDGMIRGPLTLVIDNPFDPSFSLMAELQRSSTRMMSELCIRHTATIEDLVRSKKGKIYTIKRDLLATADDMLKMYTCHHFLIAPSRAGGVELPLIESQACGVVPIGMKVSGMADYYTSAALQVRSDRKEPVRDPKWFPAPTDYGTWDVPSMVDLEKQIAIAGGLGKQDWEHRSQVVKEEINNICNYNTIVADFFRELSEHENARGNQGRVGRLPQVRPI